MKVLYGGLRKKKYYNIRKNNFIFFKIQNLDLAPWTHNTGKNIPLTKNLNWHTPEMLFLRIKVTQLLFLRHVGYCGIPLADNQLPRATPTANPEVALAPSTETDEGQHTVSNCETV